MKKAILIFSTLLLSLISFDSVAADRIGQYSIKEALQRGYDEGRIDRSIRLHFKGQRRPRYRKTIRTYRTSKKANAFARSDEKACQWAFLSAIRALTDRAKKVGGRAVVDIVSNYKNRRYSSATKFQCGAGAVMAGVALRGKVVR